MPITKLISGNFKGFKEIQSIPLSPLTIFFGKNSSGKSSAIHAISALAQTIKIPNTTQPLILDHEYAYVHLGRFIEVNHSKAYATPITLGFETAPVQIETRIERRSTQKLPVKVVCTLSCSKRTQTITLDSIEYNYGDTKLKVKQSKKKYTCRSSHQNLSISVAPSEGFFFTWLPTKADIKHFENYFELQALQRVVQEELQNVLYLGPFRDSPRRRYQTRGASPSEVGAFGEATVTMLANEIVQRQSRTHVRQIAKWLEELGLGSAVDVRRVGQSDLFDLNISLPDGHRLPLADVGFGVSQVLPVLTQCSFASSGSSLLFEQPELHLHPLATRGLANIFAETVRSKKCTIIAETHSIEMIRQIQTLLTSKKLTHDQVSLYKVERIDGKTRFSPIAIDRDEFEIDDTFMDGVSRVR